MQDQPGSFAERVVQHAPLCARSTWIIAERVVLRAPLCAGSTWIICRACSIACSVVCRINLDHLQNADEAVRVVRATQSIDGAKMVAK